ncbi:MAG: ester cyclase [Bacteroidota bacterium]
MKSIHSFFLAIIIFTAIISCSTNKNNTNMKSQAMSEQDAIKLVKPFYDFLGGDATPAEVQPSYHNDWVSYYDNSSGRSMEETLGFVSGPLAQMIPDLKWSIKKVYVTSENTIVVRGEAVGTPVGDNFMGTPIAGGKSFKFMSIDIHELKDDKIIKTYHVEDWINAIQQVAGE